MTRAQLKAMAKAQIEGKIGSLFVITLVYSLVTTVAGSIYGIGPLVSAFVISPAITIAMTVIYLSIARFPDYRPKVSHLFEHFDKFWLSFKITFFTSIFTALWSLLFVIPGIIKGYSYSQAYFIAAENPEIGALEAIRRSQQMMDGHKAEMFVLSLSFIGWYLLTPLTLGLLSIWLVPYIQTTIANYYLYLCGYFEPVFYETDADFQYNNQPF